MPSLLQLESAGRVLKVSEAKLEDSGKYTCLATNAAGEAQQHLRLSVYGNDAQSIPSFSIICPSNLCFKIHILRQGPQLQHYCLHVQCSVCLSEPPKVPHAGDIINQTILAGFSTQLECEATGNPLPGNMARVSDSPSNSYFSTL